MAENMRGSARADVNSTAYRIAAANASARQTGASLDSPRASVKATAMPSAPSKHPRPTIFPLSPAAIPDQQQMDEAESQQGQKAAGQPIERPPRAGQALELHGQADPEQEREQRECLEFQAVAYEAHHDPVDQARRSGRCRELGKDRYPKPGKQVDAQDTEQCHAAQDVDRIDTQAGLDGAWCGVWNATVHAIG